MIAKIAYLSTPGPGRYVLNFQPFGSDELQSVEISKAHLANIIIDGTSLALRESSVFTAFNPASPTEDANERNPAGRQSA
jgi:hypothetical protein